jgi:hypothetical protein
MFSLRVSVTDLLWATLVSNGTLMAATEEAIYSTARKDINGEKSFIIHSVLGITYVKGTESSVTRDTVVYSKGQSFHRRQSSTKTTVQRPGENLCAWLLPWCGTGGMFTTSWTGGLLLMGPTRDLHYYTQTEDIKQLRASCGGRSCTVYCRRCDSILDWITCDVKVSSVRTHGRLLSVVYWIFVEQILSQWLVATRHSSRNIAHARISKYYQGFLRGRWTSTYILAWEISCSFLICLCESQTWFLTLMK